MIYFILFDILLLMLSWILFKNNLDFKVISVLFVLGFTIYSGIGIIYYEINDSIIYLANFVLFSLAFIFTGYLLRKKKINIIQNLNKANKNFHGIFNFLAVMYVVTFLYPIFSSGFNIYDFLNFFSYFTEYKATPFSIRVARMADPLYLVMVNQIRTICMPFFYVYLYNLRSRPFLFLSIYFIPIYCKIVADGYISRNNIAVYFTFILIYLVTEKYLSKKVAIFAPMNSNLPSKGIKNYQKRYKFEN